MQNAPLTLTKSGIGIALSLLLVGGAVSLPIQSIKAEASISQQTRKVTGTVADIHGEPLLGVNVVEKGTTNGTMTDFDGNYTLEVSANSTLDFSYIGYITQSVPVTSNTLNVVLAENTQAIDEVVVVGYGTRKAGEVTGAVSTVKAGEIQKLAVVNVGEALKTVPGVTTLQSNTPGASPTIRIRGLGTINNNDPLWVVDGVPGGTVNPNNIESMTILKDAAAQAIYGTRAANGVILVTTKSGKKSQKTQININVKSGIVKNANHYKMLNTKEYGEMLWLQAKNDGISDYSHPLYGSGSTPDIPDYIFPNRGVNVDESLYDNLMIEEDGTDTYLITKANKEGTDWLREIERTAQIHDISMDVSGGSENTVYAFQLGYLKQEGVLKYTGYDRYNLQSNVTSDVTKWLQVGENLGITYSERYGNDTNNAEDSPISWAYRMQPIIPVHDIAGNYAGTRVGGNSGNARNPLFLLDTDQNDMRKKMNISGSVFAKITPLEGLSLKTLFGFNYMSYNVKDINYVEKAFAERGKYDYLYRTNQFSKQWNWTNTAEYTKMIGAHSITAMLGTEAVAYDFNETKAERYNFTLKDPSYIELNTGVAGQVNSGYLTEWSLFSIFGRVNYAYDNKYLFEGVVRRDGSSRFGGNNKYGTFPAFSVGWRISNEPFMASTRNWLDALKIRGGFGITGNDQVGSNYNSYTQYAFDLGKSFYPLTGDNGSQGNTGFLQKTFGNDNVKWETTKTTNIGLDATLFQSLTFNLDIWQRRTTDMLYPKAIPHVLGQATAPSVNVGEMSNKGFDFEIGYSGEALAKELNYFVSLNVSHYKNKIESLSGSADEFLEGSGFREQYYTRSQQGTAFPEFYGYVVDGIFQTQEEANAWPVAFGENGTYNKPGHYKYRDISGPDGKPDGVINAYDRTYIGSPHPKFVTGLNFSVEYKNFDLSGQLFASYGNKMVNYVRRFIDFAQFNGGRSHDRLYNSWGSPYLSDNSKAKLPIAEGNDTQSQVPSTAFIEDASYLRLRNLQLGYNLGNLLKVKGISSLRIYAQVTNLFTITNYSGLDPEVNITGSDKTAGSNLGIDSGAWPTPRQYMFGLNVGF
ncbi:SusC/RagA family TonB-linked outer membrane protein [Massilibacteroides vaginae]|uniref:SusC/RagA family TonB-linked outer membrane protein n=1 Tax=Massilibacteroides vaginae TaxID=1673718 RepID=UPI000A1C9382|nr:TonB-dependent receptor [Massilibacteroides vaginae]